MIFRYFLNKMLKNHQKSTLKHQNSIKYITSGTLSRPAGAFWPNNLIKIHKIGHIIHPKRKKHEKENSNIALNRILTLPDYFSGLELLISSRIIDLQNNFIILVRKQHKYRISVPMLYIVFL